MSADSNGKTGQVQLKLSRVQFSVLSLVLISVMVCIAYGGSFSVPFHFDDDIHITENRYIRMEELSLGKIKESMIQDGKHNRPFSNLSFAINYYLFAEEAWSYHIINLLFHLLSTAGVFFLVERTLRLGGYPEGLTQMATTLSTAVWAVHPVHTQAVTYIVQRQTLMASAFMLGCLLAYVEGRITEDRRRKYTAYGLSALSFVIAAGSKEIALVTPVLMFLYELFFFQKFSLDFMRRRWLAAVIIIIPTAVIGSYMLRPEMLEKITGGYESYTFTMGDRLLTEPRVIVYYLGIILLPLPSRLSLEHDFTVSTSIVHPWTTLPAFLLILSVLVWSLWRGRSRPMFGFAVLWYLANLAMESSFIPLDLMVEHRLYLASLALIVPLIAGLLLPSRFLGKPLGAQARLAVPALIIILLLISTMARNRVWQDPLSLWQDCVKKAPLNARPWNNLCAVQVLKGHYQEAVKSCEKALSLNDRIPDAYNNLGIASHNLGRLQEARDAFEKAVEMDPDYAIAHFNLAECHRLEGNLPEAVRKYHETLKADPYYIPAHFNLANIYYTQGELDKAIEQYRMIIKYNPRVASSYVFLARALYQKKEFAACVEVAEKALKLDPAMIELWLLKGSSLMHAGKLYEAYEAYDKVLMLQRDNPDALVDIGQIYLKQGMMDKAEDALYHVKFFHPDNPRVKELERAIEEYKKLQQQQPE